MMNVQNNMSVDGKEDYSDLPPNQKKKKLQAKVHELSKQVAQEQAAMEGLMKMKGVYETNPTLGDPMTVEGQLNECCDKLKKLRAQLRKYEELLTEANSQVCAQPVHPTARTNGTAHTQATSESLSRSASESSVSTGGCAGAGVTSTRAAGGSPESGLGGELAAAHVDTHDHDHDDHDHDDHHDHDHDHESDFDYYYEPDLQPLGYCKALYAFEGWSAVNGFWCWKQTPVTAGRGCGERPRGKRASCRPRTSRPRCTTTATTSTQECVQEQWSCVRGRNIEKTVFARDSVQSLVPRISAFKCSLWPIYNIMVFLL
ncbi:unnamed protein product [Leptidea sinapis]|uniref:REM-1 domain-containing protein n=1 Tax=Leptidea sinapis TaxID=189913 RepID=A0A5E4PX94_9NEOP|nr:unnamed protein product [Leptidea sinapis]